LNSKQIKVAIANQDKIIVDGLKTFLKEKEASKIIDREAVKIIWEAEGRDLMQKIRLQIPAVLILDLSLPETDSMVMLRFIKREFENIEIIALMKDDSPEMKVKVKAIGASILLSIPTEPKKVYHAILRCVFNNQLFTSLVIKAMSSEPEHIEIINKLNFDLVKLSERELHILNLIIMGFSSEEIAAKTFLSPRTIDTIRKNLKSKF
jgi:DNA-binding NarL/FixJ family response regulator